MLNLPPYIFRTSSTLHGLNHRNIRINNTVANDAAMKLGIPSDELIEPSYMEVFKMPQSGVVREFVFRLRAKLMVRHGTEEVEQAVIEEQVTSIEPLPCCQIVPQIVPDNTARSIGDVVVVHDATLVCTSASVASSLVDVPDTGAHYGDVVVGHNVKLEMTGVSVAAAVLDDSPALSQRQLRRNRLFRGKLSRAGAGGDNSAAKVTWTEATIKDIHESTICVDIDVAKPQRRKTRVQRFLSGIRRIFLPCVGSHQTATHVDRLD